MFVQNILLLASVHIKPLTRLCLWLNRSLTFLRHLIRLHPRGLPQTKYFPDCLYEWQTLNDENHSKTIIAVLNFEKKTACIMRCCWKFIHLSFEKVALVWLLQANSVVFLPESIAFNFKKCILLVDRYVYRKYVFYRWIKSNRKSFLHRIYKGSVF